MARQHVRALERWAARAERAGRAPSIASQARWLAARVHHRLDPGPIEDRLDALLRRAEVLRAPGAREALRTLLDQGVALGIVSNILHQSSREADATLGRIGLARYFASRQFSSDLPWSKPHPGPFLRCLRALGAPPRSSAHVGDLDLDAIGAERAGMRAVLYTGLHRTEFAGTSIPVWHGPRAVVRAASWRSVVRIVSPA